MSHWVGQNQLHKHSSLCRRAGGMENWVSGMHWKWVSVTRANSTLQVSMPFTLCTGNRRCARLLGQIFLTQTSASYLPHALPHLTWPASRWQMPPVLPSFLCLPPCPQDLALFWSFFLPRSFTGSNLEGLISPMSWNPSLFSFIISCFTGLIITYTWTI